MDPDCTTAGAFHQGTALIPVTIGLFSAVREMRCLSERGTEPLVIIKSIYQ